MLYDVIDYDNQVIGQIDARDSTEAWAKAGNEYGHVLDVRPATANTNMEIERDAGFIVKVGDAQVYSVNLPDWSLDYVEYPPGMRVEFRTALAKARVTTVKFTDKRIYFEQV